MERRRITDGEVRIVYEDPDGKQFVFDNDLEPVYGMWRVPSEEDCQPVIVQAPMLD